MMSTCLRRAVQNFTRLSVRAFASEATNEEQLTIVTEKNGVREITLNNPKKRNALSLKMLTTLRENIVKDVDSPDLRMMVLSANGPVFSSGHDLKELSSMNDRTQHAEIFGLCSEVMQLIQSISVPVLCKVEGLATAAGCQLVATCDIAIASEKATFCTPGYYRACCLCLVPRFVLIVSRMPSPQLGTVSTVAEVWCVLVHGLRVNVGLFCSTPAVALGRAVPRKLAMEMLFTGDPISAKRALENGLVSRVFPQETLQEETDKMVERICGNSRSVLALGKEAFYRQIVKDTSSAYTDTSCVMVDNLAIKDGKEGLSAFVEKRKPIWSHTSD